MAISNPRFPHWCRIIRKTVTDPLVDEDDITPLKKDSSKPEPVIGHCHVCEGSYDPLEEYSSGCSCCQDSVAEKDTRPSEKGQIIYEGFCRSYEKHTTSDRGEVITSYRGLSIPMTQSDWNSQGIAPQAGDEVAVDRGAYREYGRVVDINPSNFHGTHLTWRYGRD